MIFLNPLALLGLLAASIPIILHILNLRKLKKIDYSSNAFLKEMQKSKIRKLKLRQLILLIIRTLIILLITIGFSRPTVNSSLYGGDFKKVKVTAVIIFDDSQSMSARDENGEYLSQAKNAVSEIINILNDEDEVYFIKLSEIPLNNSEINHSAYANFKLLTNLTNKINYSYKHRKLEDAIRYSSIILQTSTNFNKELFIISDFQSGSIKSKNLYSDKINIPNTTQIYLVKIGTRNIDNLSVLSASLKNSILEANKELSLEVKIANNGFTDFKNHLIGVFIEDKKVSEKAINIKAGEVKDISFNIIPKNAGYLAGTVELESDDLEFDNKYFFTIYIPKKQDVLITGNLDDIFYVRQAISIKSGDSSYYFNYNISDWNNFAYNLNNVNIILASELPPDNSFNGNKLKTYLNNGGNAVIFLAANTNDSSFNKSIAKYFSISALNSFQSNNKNTFLEFGKVDYQHPIFLGMFEKNDDFNNKELESPRIYQSLNLQSSVQAKKIISLTNNYPFLIEQQIGKGKILLFSIALNTAWSDFPLKGIFVPLMHRSISYLLNSTSQQNTFIVGEEILVDIKNTTNTNITIISPDNNETILAQKHHESKSFIDASFIETPGNYKIQNKSELIKNISVNIDNAESLVKYDKNLLMETLDKTGVKSNSIHFIDKISNSKNVILETRLGVELWNIFIILALVFALIEMILSHSNKKNIERLQKIK